jgi:hypothetical protein
MHAELLWQRVRELFPDGAAPTHIDEASLVIAWPLTDDASRPNRRSQPVAVRVANEVLKALDHANGPWFETKGPGGNSGRRQAADAGQLPAHQVGKAVEEIEDAVALLVSEENADALLVVAHLAICG